MSKHAVSMHETKITPSETTPDQGEIRFQSYNFSGQLPPPEYLERYAAISPDAIRVIFDLALRQQEILAERDKNEIELYQKVVEKDSTYAMRGQWFAFFTVLAFFVLIGCAIFHHQQWVAGAALSFTALGYILKIFIQHPRSVGESKENDEVRTQPTV
jgi:uncharacterized membrane protein